MYGEAVFRDAAYFLCYFVHIVIKGTHLMSATMTIRLDDALKERLEKLASATHRSKSFLAAEAVKEFVELNEWQIQEIQAAMIEADNGEFAADSDVDQLKAKWS